MRLKDIAEKAGVSISTVSRVLSDPYSTAASPEKQKLIWNIAQEGGYIPDPIAKKLRSSHSEAESLERKTICCMLATDPKEYRDDPFYTTITSSIRTQALKNNYTVEYYLSGSSLEDISTQSTSSKNVHGLIIIGRFNPVILSDLIKKFRNIVYIGLNSIDAKCDRVVCDGFDAMQEIVKLYYENGHTNIGFIGAPDDSRVAGFKAGMKKYGLRIDPNLVVSNIVLSTDGGYVGMNTILDRETASNRISAVVCANDTTAIGALHACIERNIRVPDDINIIGMNDIEMTRYVSPSLSTIHVSLDEMGTIATTMLIDRINGGHVQNLEIKYPFWLVKRDSGPCPY